MGADRPRHGFATTVEALRLREWKLGAEEPAQVIDQFTDADFKLVVDDRADVHINSKDGRFYLGWFPEGRPGAPSEGWTLAVTGTAEATGYRVCFSIDTPTDIVAAAVATVISTSHPIRRTERCSLPGAEKETV